MIKSLHSKWLFLSVFIIIVDQLTKQWAEHVLQRNVVDVFSWFNFQLAHNKGAAFGFLNDAGGWQHWFFIALVTIVSIVLLWMITQLEKRERHLAIAYSLVLGGAIGNGIDRLVYGYVIDFIHWFIPECNMFGMQTCHWPNFNIADAAIMLGAALLISEAFGKPFLNTQDENTTG